MITSSSGTHLTFHICLQNNVGYEVRACHRWPLGQWATMHAAVLGMVQSTLNRTQVACTAGHGAWKGDQGVEVEGPAAFALFSASISDGRPPGSPIPESGAPGAPQDPSSEKAVLAL